MSGSHRIEVRTRKNLPDLDWKAEVREIPDVWPYLGPTWLAATEKMIPGATSWHTVARRGRGEFAFLPGYALSGPPMADLDPRSLLGWQPASGDQACCSVDTSCCCSSDLSEELSEDLFFPALVAGSPFGYRSEVAYSFWTPKLFASLVNELVPAAFAAGIRSIAVPWIPDRQGNEALVSALEEQGGNAAFWAMEDYIDMGASDYESHLASLPAKRRRQIRVDREQFAETGVRISRADGDEVRPLVPRIADLIDQTRDKHGTGASGSQATVMLHSLLDAGVSVRTYLAHLDETMVGCCVIVSKARRLYLKWVGFDYAALGERSGIYFPLAFEAPVRDACAEGLSSYECGAGAHRAKAGRGASARGVTSVLLVADEAVRPRMRELMDQAGEARRSLYDAQ